MLVHLSSHLDYHQSINYLRRQGLTSMTISSPSVRFRRSHFSHRAGDCSVLNMRSTAVLPFINCSYENTMVAIGTVIYHKSTAWLALRSGPHIDHRKQGYGAAITKGRALIEPNERSRYTADMGLPGIQNLDL